MVRNRADVDTNQLIGLLLLAVVIGAMFALVAIVPQKYVPQPGSLITTEKNYTGPMTMVRVIYNH
jgi:hypothetical protein